MAKPPSRDPLAPIDTAVSVLSWLVGGLLALGVVFGVAAALGGSFSVFGFGDTEVCTTGEPGPVTFRNDVPQTAVVGLKDGARWFPAEMLICKSDPGVGLRLAASLMGAPTQLLFIGFLILTRGLIKQARRTGMFTPQVATRTGRLGWYILLGSIIAAAIEALAGGIVLQAAVDGEVWLGGIFDLHTSWSALLVGIGLITIGRVLGQAALLQADVDATI
jgi:hypothetical protein